MSGIYSQFLNLVDCQLRKSLDCWPITWQQRGCLLFFYMLRALLHLLKKGGELKSYLL